MKKHSQSFIERIIFVPIACALVFSPLAYAQEAPTTPLKHTITKEQFDALSNDGKQAYIQSLNRNKSSTTPPRFLARLSPKGQRVVLSTTDLAPYRLMFHPHSNKQSLVSP